MKYPVKRLIAQASDKLLMNLAKETKRYRYLALKERRRRMIIRPGLLTTVK